MPVIAGSVCTHLLPWGCHTIMELVLAALPVETTGALLRTGAMAEIAAILFCSCGYAGTSAALRLRTSWKLETALGKNMTKRRRVFGRAAEFTVFVQS